MRAARYYGIKDIRIEEVQEPKCKPGHVKIKPAYVGICGTDLHEYFGGPTFCPTSAHPVTGETIPITLGHEFSGVVEEVGEGVDNVKVGTNVAVQPTVSCGECAPCKAGAVNVCYKGGFIGLSGGGGGLSEHVIVPDHQIFPLAPSVSLKVGALVEPLAVGWHAVDTSGFGKGESALILGGGPIGCAVIQALVAKKAKTIIVSEISGARQAFVKKFGATHVLDPRNEDVVKKVKELCGGEGPDVVFDCAGVAASLKVACKAVRAKGTVLNVAIWEKEIPFQPNDLVFSEGTYKAVLGYVGKDFRDVVNALGNGSIEPARAEEMITRVIKLEDLVEDGLIELTDSAKREKHVKILVEI